MYTYGIGVHMWYRCTLVVGTKAETFAHVCEYIHVQSRISYSGAYMCILAIAFGSVLNSIPV